MTLPLRLSAATVCWLVACITIALAPLASVPTQAQTKYSKGRAAPPAKTRPTSKVPKPAGWVPNPAVTSKDSYLIMDAMSGHELDSDSPDDLRHPASLTKLMTLYLTFAAL